MSHVPRGSIDESRARSTSACCRLVWQGRPLEQPRPVGERMRGFDFALLCGEAQRLRADAEQGGGPRQVHPPSASPVSATIDRNLWWLRSDVTRSRVQRLPCPVRRSLRLSTPAITSSLHARTSTRTASTISVAVLLRLSPPAARQAQLGVDTAHPVHDENDLSALRVEVGDHLANELAHDALLQTDVSRWDHARSLSDSSPSVANGSGLVGGVAGISPTCFLDPALQLRDAFESAVPAKLQFGRDQTIGRIGGVVLAERLVRGIAGRFEVTLERVEHLVAAARLFAVRLQAASIAPVREHEEARLRSRHRREARRTRCSAARRCRASRAGMHSAACRDCARYIGRIIFCPQRWQRSSPARSAAPRLAAPGRSRPREIARRSSSGSPPNAASRHSPHGRPEASASHSSRGLRRMPRRGADPS